MLGKKCNLLSVTITEIKKFKQLQLVMLGLEHRPSFEIIAADDNKRNDIQVKQGYKL